MRGLLCFLLKPFPSEMHLKGENWQTHVSVSHYMPGSASQPRVCQEHLSHHREEGWETCLTFVLQHSHTDVCPLMLSRDMCLSSFSGAVLAS